MRGQAVLRAIQDVEAVLGAFVGDDEGQLLFHQMPEEFDEQQLVRTTERLSNIVRCAEYCDLQVEQCNLRLSRQQLVLKRFRGGVLCVLVDAPVSDRALNMAMRIALERLPSLLDELAEENLASKVATPDTSRAEIESGRGSEPPYEDTVVSLPLGPEPREFHIE